MCLFSAVLSLVSLPSAIGHLDFLLDLRHILGELQNQLGAFVGNVDFQVW